MKILYIGKSKSIVKNLVELGVDEVVYWNDFGWEKVDGIIITQELLPEEMERLRGLKVPIILNSGKPELQNQVNVLILNEEQMNEFSGTTTWDIPQCRIKLRKLGIKHLVVSLRKKEIKQFIVFYGLPTINVKDVQITDEAVERAEDVVIAIIGYLYITEGLLVPDSIEKAKIGAILEVFGKKTETDSYHLKFNLKKK